MVVTFPHMGKMYIPIKALFDELGVDIVIPPKISKGTLETGTKLCPEMACLPLKISMGNYLASIKRGADTIVLSGSCGPCRFGYYGVVQKEILRDLGYDVDIVILDPPREGIKELLSRIRKITGNCSLYRGLKALKKAFKVCEETEKLLKLVLKKRCRELEKGSTDRILNEFEERIREIKGADNILNCIEAAKEKLVGIRIDTGNEPVRIGLVGEIYTLIEPYVNLDVEKRLGNMGVEVHREMTVDHWVKYHLAPDFNHRRRQRLILDQAKDYLGLCIGAMPGRRWPTAYITPGRWMNHTGYALWVYAEIVAESILPTLSRDQDIPIMTLVVDELTGETGYQTRLEAFVDLLQFERSKKSDEFGEVLFRY